MVAFQSRCLAGKEYGRMALACGFFHALTASPEGQLHLLRAPGAMHHLFELLALPSSPLRTNLLQVLRNVSLLKEAKSYFVVDGML
jgi:hypothetical protein